MQLIISRNDKRFEGYRGSVPSDRGPAGRGGGLFMDPACSFIPSTTLRPVATPQGSKFDSWSSPTRS
ncbi:uncharacterized [Tachysurus ichikawai]